MIKLNHKLKPSHVLDQFGVRRSVFSQQEIESIIALEKEIQFEDGKIGSSNPIIDKNIRNVQLSEDLSSNKNVEWLSSKIQEILAETNYDLFLFDIEYLEGPKYLIYNSSNNENEQGHYKPHRDTFNEYLPYNRMITGIIMLSDSSEYTGGDLYVDVHGSLDPHLVKLNCGDVAFFNSNFTHYVTKV